MRFGNIPESVLGIEITEFEATEPVTLAFMLQGITNENILYARYSVSSTPLGLELGSFHAYTESKTLDLIFTPLGQYLLVNPRKCGIIEVRKKDVSDDNSENKQKGDIDNS